MAANRRYGNKPLYTNEYDAYIEDDIKLSEKIKINAGVRFSLFAVGGKNFFNIQPRFNWLYKLTSQWNLKASYSRMNQYLHLLTNANVGLPTDLWVPVTALVPPQSSHQVSGGVSYSRDRSLEFSMEVYYKSLTNVVEYGDKSGFSYNTYSWEDMLETGKGTAYGAEWLVQKKKGTITGLASYTLSRSMRQFENLNEGREYPFKYARYTLPVEGSVNGSNVVE